MPAVPSSGGGQDLRFFRVDQDHLDTQLPEMIQHVRRRARIGVQRGDAGQGADHHVAARLELGAVGDDNQVFGAGQKLGFGPGHQRVAFDNAKGRDRIAGHEHF